ELVGLGSAPWLSLAPDIVEDGADAALRALDGRQVQVFLVLTVPEPATEHAFAIGGEEPLDFLKDCGRNRQVLDFPKEVINLAVAVTLFREPPPKFVERKHDIPAITGSDRADGRTL